MAYNQGMPVSDISTYMCLLTLHFSSVDTLVNFVFDNAGIACVTPTGEYVDPERTGSMKTQSAVAIGQFAEILIKRY